MVPVGAELKPELPLFFFFLFYLFLAVLGVCCCMGFSLVAASGGYSLVAAPSSRECGVNSYGAQAWLLCSMWDSPGSGIEPMCLLHWQMGSLPLHHQRSPELPFFSNDAGISRNILWEWPRLTLWTWAFCAATRCLWRSAHSCCVLLIRQLGPG